MATEYAVDDLNYTDSKPVMDVGTIVNATDGNKYEYIYNEGTHLAAYDVVALSSAVDLDGYVIQATNQDFMCEGVAHTAISNAEYGFACVHGIHSVALTAAMATAGFNLVCAGAGKLDTETNEVVAGEACVQFFGYETSATAGTPLCRIACI